MTEPLPSNNEEKKLHGNQKSLPKVFPQRLPFGEEAPRVLGLRNIVRKRSICGWLIFWGSQISWFLRAGIGLISYNMLGNMTQSSYLACARAWGWLFISQIENMWLAKIIMEVLGHTSDSRWCRGPEWHAVSPWGPLLNRDENDCRANNEVKQWWAEGEVKQRTQI